MSMQAMQQILCRGAVDRGFLNSLLEAPYQALAEFELSTDERTVLAESPARSLVDLAQAVEVWRRGEPLGISVRELALAG